MNGYVVTMLMGLLLGGSVVNTAIGPNLDSSDAVFSEGSHALSMGSDRSEVAYANDISRESYATHLDSTASFST